MPAKRADFLGVSVASLRSGRGATPRGWYRRSECSTRVCQECREVATFTSGREHCSWRSVWHPESSQHGINRRRRRITRQAASILSTRSRSYRCVDLRDQRKSAPSPEQDQDVVRESNSSLSRLFDAADATALVRESAVADYSCRTVGIEFSPALAPSRVGKADR